ncbi:MAG TPA: YHS domain-containing protein [Methanolinea sp.]|nr:YHS domain-containing protein [Methanolinea sp.]
MPTDPVCYMVFDEDKSQCRLHYKGQEYFFCSDFCRKKFEENPARYAKLARSMDIGPDISC